MLEDKRIEILSYLGTSFIFEVSDVLPSECKQVQNLVEKTAQILQTNFKAQKDSVVSYREENGIRFSNEVDGLVEKTAKINQDAEFLKNALFEIEGKIKLVESRLKDGHLQSKELEIQRQNFLSEKSKVVEDLERVEKGFECALLLYRRYLGFQVERDASDSNKLICIFHSGSRMKILPRKVVINTKNDSFRTNDGTVLKEKISLMEFLLKERIKCLSGN